MRRTPLAWKNLSSQPTRTIVSVAGIAFAILLMFMQLGFLGAVGTTATMVYERMPFDLVLRSPEYLHLFDSRSIPDQTSRWIGSLPEIKEIRTIDLTVATWKNPNPKSKEYGQFRAVAVLGIDPEKPAIKLPELDNLLPLLRRPDNVLVDRTSRPDFGPQNGTTFGEKDIGHRTDVTTKEVRIAGTFEMGTGLAANGAIIISRDGFQLVAPDNHYRRASLILVDVDEGHSSVAEAADAIGKRLNQIGGSASTIQVFNRKQAIKAERRRWYKETPVGLIFSCGVGLAFLVGGVICYMVLAADVIAHLPEYATLKAMGSGSGFLSRVLFGQAFLLASMAMPPALAASLILYKVTSKWSGLPIEMTGWRILWVTILTLLMCSWAGIAAVKKLSKAEPANLF